MGWSSIRVSIFVLCWACLGLSRQEWSPVIRAVGIAENDKTGCYVVVLKNSTDATFETMKSTLLGMSQDLRLHGAVKTVAKAITVMLNESALSTVSSTAAL